MKKVIKLSLVLFILALNMKVFAGGDVFLIPTAGATTIHNTIKAAWEQIRTDGGGIFISQNYTISVKIGYTIPGSGEVLPINLNAITQGAGGPYTVTIRPDAANDARAILITTATFAGPMIDLNGSDNVIIDGQQADEPGVINWRLENLSTDALSGTIQMQNGAKKNIVRYMNCFNLGFATNTGGRNINIAQTTLGAGEGNDDNAIRYCCIEGGRRGIQTFGTAGIEYNTNLTVYRCIIRNFSAIGLFIGSVTKNVTVDYCQIYHDAAVQVNSQTSGIQIQGTGNILISHNKIYNLNNPGLVPASYLLFGILCFPVAVAPLPLVRPVVAIATNYIALCKDNTLATHVGGIVVSYIAGQITNYGGNICNNTVRVGGVGTHPGAAAGGILSIGIENDLDLAGATKIQDDNISMNFRSGGSLTAFHIGNLTLTGASAIVPTFDRNKYYAVAPIHGFAAAWNGSPLRNITGLYRTDAFPWERITNLQAVAFVKACDDPLPDGPIDSAGPNPNLQTPTGGNLLGIPINPADSALAFDVEGNLRNTSFPYIGAVDGPPLRLLTVKACLEACPRDVLEIEIRNSTSPYSLVSSSSGLMDSTGAATVGYGDSVATGTNYYIAVRNRNSIETWSSSTVSLTTASPSVYDFTTGLNKAFGNNMVLVGGKACFYTGDVNQDGTVDISDIAAIDNDAFKFVSGGYVTTDLNCDGIVDISDIALADNNAANFVSVIRPFGPERPVVKNQDNNNYVKRYAQLPQTYDPYVSKFVSGLE